MKKKTGKSLTRKQLEELRALAALPDRAIDTSDAPELNWSGSKRGLFYRPVKQQLTLRLDSDVIAWFKRRSARGYQTRINQALREYLRWLQKNYPDVLARSDTGDEFPGLESAPGYEPSASDCLKRALSIARSLEHKRLSSDHLMLALTMDQNARRLLDHVADTTSLREFAMLRLGKLHSRLRGRTADIYPARTSDFVEIQTAARQAAADRNELITVSDLIHAFPQTNGRLSYGLGDHTSVTKPGHMPKMDFTTFMETERQVASELRSRITEAVDRQFTAVTQSLDEKLVVTWIRQSSNWL